MNFLRISYVLLNSIALFILFSNCWSWMSAHAMIFHFQHLRVERNNMETMMSQKQKQEKTQI